MTVCDKCRGAMVITLAMIDFGEGAEEFEFEACLECDIVYVGAFGWTVKPS